MYAIIVVGIGIVIGMLLGTWIDLYNTRDSRKNFKRNLDEWKNDNNKT